MNKEQNMETRLWDYIDGLCSDQERDAIQQLLKEHIIWKRKYDELLDFNKTIKTLDTEEPSMRFKMNVMEAVKNISIAPATKSQINYKIIRFIGFFFIGVIFSLLVYSFGLVEWSFAESDTFNISIQIPKVNTSLFSNPFILNSFLMLNVVLGLMLMDNYLTNRRKLHS